MNGNTSERRFEMTLHMTANNISGVIFVLL